MRHSLHVLWQLLHRLGTVHPSYASQALRIYVLQGLHAPVVPTKPIIKSAHIFTITSEIPCIVSLELRTVNLGAPRPVLPGFPNGILFTHNDEALEVA
jgi:hypothetical protein